MISGLSGTELFRLSYNQYFKKNNDLNLATFLAEHVELVDLMHDQLLTKKSYFEHLKNFYGEKLNGVKYEKAKDLSSYIDYFAFYRTQKQQPGNGGSFARVENLTFPLTSTLEERRKWTLMKLSATVYSVQRVFFTFRQR